MMPWWAYSILFDNLIIVMNLQFKGLKLSCANIHSSSFPNTWYILENHVVVHFKQWLNGSSLRIPFDNSDDVHKKIYHDVIHKEQGHGKMSALFDKYFTYRWDVNNVTRLKIPFVWYIWIYCISEHRIELSYWMRPLIKINMVTYAATWWELAA